MTSSNHNNRRVDIRFHSDGRIDINANVAKQLALKNGDVINIRQQGGEFYIYIYYQANTYIGKYDATVYATNKNLNKSNNFRAYSKRLCRMMFSECRCSSKTLSLFAGSSVVLPQIALAVPVITLNPICNND